MQRVQEETSQQDDVALLLKQSDDLAAALYPGEHRQPLDRNSLAAPGIHVLVARIDTIAVGCCALMELGNGTAELKRMVVDPSARRQGVGSALLRGAEQAALSLGVSSIQMEVGVRNIEGQALYRKAGYVERGPFGRYNASPLSFFFEKSLRKSDDPG